MTADIDKRFKILILAEDKFPPFRVDVATLFGKELPTLGYSIDWILQSDAQCSSSYTTKWSDCDVWVGKTDLGTSRLSRLKKHFFELLNDMKMFKLISLKDYDFIQVKDKFLSALPAIIAAKKTRAKFIFWLSYPFPEASIYESQTGVARYPLLYLIRGYFLKFLLYKIILPNAHHIFAQSAQMKKDIIAWGIPAEKITPVPMGVELKKIPFNSISNTTREEKRVLYLGTLKKVRKIDFLIRVFAKVLQDVPDAKLYLVGGGEYPGDEQMIKDEIDRLEVKDSVNMTGFLPMDEAWEYVKKANVCVSPFYPTFILNSTSPTKLVEYMAIGKAVIANDHPEQKLVIAESNGGICVRYDELEFAEAIILLLNNPDKADKMGKNGRKYVEEHRAYNAIASSVNQVYQEIAQ